jgi:soluble lytic murein transglycosylase-like protein
MRIACLLIFLSLFSAAVYSAPNGEQERQALAEYLQKSLHNADSFEDQFDAQVWLMTMQQPLGRFIKSPEERLELLTMIHKEATRAEVPPDLVLALIEIESHFKRFAISRVGAQGMMQVMPFWKNEIGRPEDNLTDVATNLRYGCTILKFYIDREDGRLAPALARYNGSYGRRIYSDKVLKVWDKHWYGPPF